MRTVRSYIVIAVALLVLSLLASAPADARRHHHRCPPGYTFYAGQCVPAAPYGYYGRWGPYGPRYPDNNRAAGCSPSLLLCQQQCEAMRRKMDPLAYAQCRQNCQIGYESCVY
ncbi:hypothetical protein [Oceanidesulfovibrio marinus]|uniref:Uncharacterized protein n=1 Tax=Oceanidesulfovibrio marinus TaxID=370038 RepID=A0ABX6NJT7_9BACT|nr:hypothetical protein [Oceanidesulfovibrio marinus]QJT10938.1 hypothetical protein E8L03_19370 [Oceanidesulfovibrio marinus]